MIDWIITRQHYGSAPNTTVCSSAQIEELWKFTNDCIGEGPPLKVMRFLNWIRPKIILFRHDIVWLKPGEVESIEGIKLRFRPGGAWQLPTDADGVEENDDPDGYLVERVEDPFESQVWRSIDWYDRPEPTLP
jgi:hypothetical protein